MNTNQAMMTIPSTNILVVDLEATCSNDERITGADMEIIEIGACWIDSKGKLLDTFQSFVRPVLNVRLTQFCTELTTITQAQVDEAEPFNLVAPRFKEFVEKYAEPNSIWGSWGNYDRVQFEHDAARHGMENPVAHLPHRNFKKRFAKQRRIKQVGMMKALEIAGIEHTGAHHRGLDDAINIAKLVFAGAGV